jgi:hypothetical protein
MEDQGIEIPGASGDGGLRVALRSANNMPRAGRGRGTKAGQGQDSLIPEMFEKRAALFILEFPGRALPLEKFADGFGQFRQAEVGEITNGLTDEFELDCGKIPTRKGNIRCQHGGSPLLLSLPYLKRGRMSRKKCDQSKKFQERDAEAVLEHSDCSDQPAKMRRQPADRFIRGNAGQAGRNGSYAACQD